MTVEVKRRDKVSTFWTAHGMDTRGGTTRLLARDVTAAEGDAPISLALEPTIAFEGGNSIHEHITTGTLAPGRYYVELEHTTADGRGPYTFHPPGEAFDLLIVWPDLG